MKKIKYENIRLLTPKEVAILTMSNNFTPKGDQFHLPRGMGLKFTGKIVEDDDFEKWNHGVYEKN
jgi:hypothetical protein